MEIGYWPSKGLAEPCRWTLAYLGIEHTEWNPKSPEDWAARKSSTGDFPNLPYLRDGDFTITETAAMWTYAAVKAGKPEFLGKDAQEIARVRQVEGVMSDVLKSMGKAMYAEDKISAIKEAFAEGSDLSNKLGELNKYLEGRQFFVSNPTIADLLCAYFIEFCCTMTISFLGECSIKKYTNILAHASRVRNLPGIKENVEKRTDEPYHQTAPLKKFSELTCLNCD